MTLVKQVFVSGTVQGVGYRFFAVRVARVIGVRGFVRNLPDGRVEVVAEAAGEVELERLIGALRQGPPASHVSGVTVEDYPVPESFTGFDIRY